MIVKLIPHLLIILNTVLVIVMTAASLAPRYITIYGHSVHATWYPMFGIALVSGLLALYFFVVYDRS